MATLTASSSLKRLVTYPAMEARKQMVVGWREAWGVCGMPKDIPPKISKQRRDEISCIRSCVLMNEKHVTWQFSRTFLFDGFSKTHKGVEIKFPHNRDAFGSIFFQKYSIIIPKRRKMDLSCRPFTLGFHWTLITFSDPLLWSAFHLKGEMVNPFLIHSHNPVQEVLAGLMVVELKV